jgi:hypothetical protein
MGGIPGTGGFLMRLSACKRTDDIVQDQGKRILDRKIMTGEQARVFIQDIRDIGKGNALIIHACEEVLVRRKFDRRILDDPQWNRWMERYHPRCNNCGQCGVA